MFKNIFIFIFFLSLISFPISLPAQSPSESDQPLDLNLSDSPSETGTTDNSQKPDKEPNFIIQILQMLGVLAFVLALIALFAYLARKFLPASAGLGRSNMIRIVASQMLGGRRSLLLVRVRGQTLLLGLTPQSITCLTEIHEVEGEWAQSGDEPEKNTPFEANLNQALKEKQ